MVRITLTILERVMGIQIVTSLCQPFLQHRIRSLSFCYKLKIKKSEHAVQNHISFNTKIMPRIAKGSQHERHKATKMTKEQQVHISHCKLAPGRAQGNHSYHERCYILSLSPSYLLSLRPSFPSPPFLPLHSHKVKHI